MSGRVRGSWLKILHDCMCELHASTLGFSLSTLFLHIVCIITLNLNALRYIAANTAVILIGRGRGGREISAAVTLWGRSVKVYWCTIKLSNAYIKHEFK